jgi:hypothetical protein
MDYSTYDQEHMLGVGLHHLDPLIDLLQPSCSPIRPTTYHGRVSKWGCELPINTATSSRTILSTSDPPSSPTGWGDIEDNYLEIFFSFNFYRCSTKMSKLADILDDSEKGHTVLATTAAFRLAKFTDVVGDIESL